MARIVPDSYDKLFCRCEGFFRSNASIDDEDMVDITDWTDADQGGAASTQVTFDGKSCMKLDGGATAGAGNYAYRSQDIGSMGTRTVISWSSYVTNQGANDSLTYRLYNGSGTALFLKLSATKFYVYNSGAYGEVGTNLVVSDSWQEWTLDINWTAFTVDVYLNGVIVGNDVAFGYATAGADGAVGILQLCFTNANCISYIDWFKAGADIKYDYFKDSSTASPKEITANGNAVQLPIKFNRSAGFFNGTTDYVVVPDSADFTFGSGNFKIELYVNFTGGLSGTTISTFLKKAETAGQREFQFDYKHATGLRFIYYADATNPTIVANAWTPSLNTWYKVTAERVTNTLTVSIDDVAQATTGDMTGVTLADGTDTLAIGATSAPANYLSGWLKNLTITKASTLVLDMRFDSPATSPLGPAIAFDGTGDYLSLADSADWDLGTGEWTAEAFVNFSAIGTQPPVISIGESYSGEADGISISYYPATPCWYVYINGSAYTFADSTLVTGKWYHVSAQRSGNNLQFFRDGVQKGSNVDITAKNITAGTKGVSIGHDTNGYPNNYYLNGFEREVRISNVARYTTAFTPSQSGFTVDANTKLYIKGSESAEEVFAGKTCSISAGTGTASNGVDGNLTSYVYTITSGAGNWFKVDLGAGNAKKVTKIGIYTNDNIGNSPDDFLIQGSNDDSNWTTLATVVDFPMALNTWTHQDFTNTTAYRYYRLYDLTAQSEANTYFTEIRGWDFTGTVINGSTAFVDSETTPKTITTQGDTKIKYTEDYRSCIFKDETGKFPYPVGSAKVDFFALGDGCYYGDRAAASRLTIPNNADFDFGTGNFTLEFYIRHIDLANVYIYMQKYTGGANSWIWYMSSTTNWAFYYTSSGPVNLTTPTVIANKWWHYCIVRDGNTLRAFLDGTAYGTADVTGITYGGSAATIEIGGDSTNMVKGLMDNIRISKGIARYTSSFNPPDDYQSWLGYSQIIWID